jgi:hypothetical protein
MVQIVSAEEREFPFRGDLEFEDLETGERRLLDAAAVAGQYRSALEEFLTRCRREAQRDGIDYALMSTGDAPERAMREFLLRRAEPLSYAPAGKR